MFLFPISQFVAITDCLYNTFMFSCFPFFPDSLWKYQLLMIWSRVPRAGNFQDQSQVSSQHWKNCKKLSYLWGKSLLAEHFVRALVNVFYCFSLCLFVHRIENYSWKILGTACTHILFRLFYYKLHIPSFDLMARVPNRTVLLDRRFSWQNKGKIVLHCIHCIHEPSIYIYSWFMAVSLNCTLLY